MPAETGPIIFYSQKFDGIALPQGPDIGEAARLRAAAIGSYELLFRQQPQYEFSGAFLFNDETPEDQRVEPQRQFEVSETIAEVERSLIIQNVTDGGNLNSVELVPLDWRENPLAFTLSEDSEFRRTLRYPKDVPVESLKLKLSGVNVFDVETINSVIRTGGRSYSPATLTTSIRRLEDIRLDRLDNSGNGTRKIEDHLLTFFRLLLEKDSKRNFDFECGYRYSLADGGPNALVPVMFRKSLNLPAASELFPELLAQLRDWYRSVSPAEGVFNFGVKIYGGSAGKPRPVLHFTSLVLPISSIAGWSDAGAV